MEVKTKMKLRPKRRRRFASRRSHTDGGKKPSLIWLPVICVAAAFVFALVLGLYLGSRATEEPDDGTSGDGGYTIDYSGSVVSTRVQYAAYATPATVRTEAELRSLAESLLSQGYDTLTVSLQHSDGTVAFASSVKRLMYPDVPDRIDVYELAQVVSIMKEKGISVEGVFYCDHKHLEGAARQAVAAYEAALIREACELGIDGVSIIGLPLESVGDELESVQAHLESEDFVFSLNWLSALRRSVSHTDTLINTAVPLSALIRAEKNGFDPFPYIARCTDGVCVDFASGAELEDENGALITDCFEYLKAFNVRYYTERYGIRILISRDRAFDARALHEAGYKNVGLIDLG